PVTVSEMHALDGQALPARGSSSLRPSSGVGRACSPSAPRMYGSRDAGILTRRECMRTARRSVPTRSGELEGQALPARGS
ncbi:MAG: hypothetical protein JXR40_02860, partial [Pontiellaceae bacterium]|nr:hypothetical protein [Pontiellaceae bacterium]